MDFAEAQIYLGQRMCGRYLIRQFLGSGAFAGVFEAVDEHAEDAPVAVKILSIQAAQSPDARLEFDGERELLRVLTGCSNVVTLLDADQHRMTLSANGVNFTVDASFLVLELAEASLAELLLHRHKIAWSDRLQLFRDIAKGVHQMHLQRMVHRDAKADNALVFPRQPLAKVSDLGRSCRTENPRRFPLEDYIIGRGDLRFAGPELIFGCGSDDPLAMARADIYSSAQRCSRSRQVSALRPLPSAIHGRSQLVSRGCRLVLARASSADASRRSGSGRQARTNFSGPSSHPTCVTQPPTFFGC